MSTGTPFLPYSKRHLVLLLLIAAQSIWLAWRIPAQPTLPEIPVIETAVPEPRRDGELRDAPQSSLKPAVEAEDRPLFNPTRRRIAVPVAAQQTNAVSPRPFREPVLLGIAGVGENRIALVKFSEERDSRRLRSGDSLEGWRVTEIGEGHVIFGNGDEKREIRLKPAQRTPDGAGARSIQSR